jgi:hypothetical protein
MIKKKESLNNKPKIELWHPGQSNVRPTYFNNIERKDKKKNDRLESGRKSNVGK